MSKSPFDLSFQERRCQLGIHNYINFMDSPLELEYYKDIPEEVMVCKLCKQITTPYELQQRMQQDDWNNFYITMYTNTNLCNSFCME